MFERQDYGRRQRFSPFSSVGASAEHLGEVAWWFPEIDPVMCAVYGYGRRECLTVPVYRLSDGAIWAARETAEGAVLWYDLSDCQGAVLGLLQAQKGVTQ